MNPVSSSAAALTMAVALVVAAGCGGGDASGTGGSTSTTSSHGGAGGHASHAGGSGGSGGGASGGAGGGATPTNYCGANDLVVDNGAYDPCQEGPYETWPVQGQNRVCTQSFKDQVVAFKVVVPDTFNPPLDVTHLGFGHFAEVPGGAVTARQVTVSFNPCDFQSGSYLVDGIAGGDTAPGANFTANNPNGWQAAGANFNVDSGDTVYFNIRNRTANGDPSCPNESCDVLFDLAAPNRY